MKVIKCFLKIGPVSNNELVQQLLTFKSANDRWIKKNNVSEDGMGMLLTCNDRILSAISLLQQMVKEGEIKSFPNLNQISVEESYFPDPSGVNSVDGQNPINNINHQPPHHFDLQKPLPQVNLKQPLEDDYRPLSLKNSREMGSGYIPPLDKDLIFGSHHLPNPGDNQSLEPDDVSMLESEDSVVNEITEQLERVSKVMDENNEVPLLPSQTVNNPLYVEDKVLDEVTEDLEDVKVVDENLGFNDGAVDDEVLDEITEKRINRIVPNQELNASNDSDEGQVVSNIQLKGESDHGEEVQHISILPPQQEDAQVESDQVSHAEEVQHMSILPPQQEDAQVGDNQHAIISKEDSVSGAVISDVKEELEDDKSALCLNLVDFPKEAVVSTPSQEAPPISSVREPDTVLSPPPDSTKPAFIKEAKLQNSKRYFFNHPPEAWTDLQDIKTTMSRAFEELTNAANLMESRHSDRSANVKVYIAKGRQIHDLAQFAIDHWEPRIKDCRNPMVKKDLFSSFQQMGAMRGVLAVLLKRKFSDVKEGDDGHLLSSCKDLKMIFDSAMGNLIAYELTKEQ